MPGQVVPAALVPFGDTMRDGHALHRVLPGSVRHHGNAELVQGRQELVSLAWIDLRVVGMVGPKQYIAIVRLRRRDVLPNFLLVSVADFQDRKLDAFALPLVRLGAVRGEQGFDRVPAVCGKARANRGEHIVSRQAHSLRSWISRLPRLTVSSCTYPSLR